MRRGCGIVLDGGFTVAAQDVSKSDASLAATAPGSASRAGFAGTLAASPGASPGASGDPHATRASGQAPAWQGEVVAFSRGAALGRYITLDRLGAGAMGVVYAAFDPELDRKVAIKLLLPDNSAASRSVREDARARLLREATALARLSHPNVVAIFDVGTHGDAVWIAMELVEGRTLRDWLGERRRGWREVLAVMQAAGRGLAAAHAAGLVHRDIKPDNVMIAGDGRVRVMDFGLARPASSRAQDGAAGERPSGLGVAVTQVGSLLGTPAYMASEQLRGEEVGPQADVFAFCVMLWEGLYGARPFVGQTIEALRVNVEAGRVARAPSGRGVPRWLDRVLVRGLAPASADRWADMAAVLAELERGQTRSRRRGVAAVVGGALAGAAALVFASSAWQRAEREAEVVACVALGDRVDEVWSPATRERLHGALAASPQTFARATADLTLPWIDAWAAEWRQVRVDTCTRHAVERTWSADLRGRADECLEEGLLELTALVRELTTAGDDVVIQAVDAVTGLTAASACGAAEELARRPALPAERARLDALRPVLARAWALDQAGKYKEALGVAREGLVAAEAVGWPPTVAEARHLVGYLEHQTGDFAAAAASLEEAYFVATRASADAVATDAATLRSYVAGGEMSRVEEGLHWSRLAELGLARLGGGRTLRAALWLNNRGIVHRIAGDFSAARADLTAASEILAELLAADHPTRISASASLAVVEAQLGDLEGAGATLMAALASVERVYGPDHPQVADLLTNVGTLRMQQRDFTAAEQLYRRVLAIRERALGPEHVDVAEALGNVASAEVMLGQLGEVEATYGRVLAIEEKALGPENPALARPLNNLGYAQDALGKHAEALVTHERALAICRRAFGEDHVDVAMSLANLGSVRLHMGQLDEAERLFRQALAIRERVLPAGARELVTSARQLALVAARRGDIDEARARLERVTPQSTPAQLAEIRFALAQAWWERSPPDRAAARALAELARDGLTARKDAGRLAEVEAWLVARAEPR